eukprot:5745222-Pyramimonas_sp.AAC.1
MLLDWPDAFGARFCVKGALVKCCGKRLIRNVYALSIDLIDMIDISSRFHLDGPVVLDAPRITISPRSFCHLYPCCRQQTNELHSQAIARWLAEAAQTS